MKLGLLMACSALVAIAQPAFAGNPGIDFTGGQDFGSSVWNLGYSFTANTNVSVVGLGNWAGAEFPQDQQVGLWDSQGNLLASAFVSNSDTSIGAWKFHSIAAVQLVAGQTYIVGGQGGAEYTGLISNVTVDSRITYGTDLFTDVGTQNDPLVMPTDSEGEPHGWFGGNVELASGAVPEPASWALMLGGFGAIGGAMRSRRKTAVSFG